MLVLTVKEGDYLVLTLPDRRRLRIAAVDCRSDRVRIGIEAPADVQVNRRDIQEAMDRERQGPQRCVEEDDLRPAPETVVPPKKGDVL